MNVLPHIAPATPVVLDLSANQTWRERHRAAMRDLVEGWQLGRLCWTLAWLDIRLRYRGSVLGPFWLTISTGAMVASMGLLYAVLFRLNLRDYIPFLALSLVLWAYLGNVVSEGCAAFTAAEGTVRSVRMPFTLYAGRIVLRNLVVLAHNALVVVVVDLVLSFWPGRIAALAVPGIILWLVNSLAVTLLLGAICARFRDIPPIVASLMQLAFFISAVIWRPDQLGAFEWMLAFNPFFSLLEVVRGPLFGVMPTKLTILMALLYSVALWVVTWVVFARVRGRIAFWL
jgi:lipopolysaccharide transport system permease protein